MRPSVCLDYEVFGLVLSDLHVRNVPVQLACIRPYELIAFSDLDAVSNGDSLPARLGGLRIRTCACGSGLKKTDLMDSIFKKGEPAETQLCFSILKAACRR